LKKPQFQLHEEIEERHWWFLGRRRIIGALLDSVLTSDSLVVDVGCGTGGTIASLADRYRCLGVDPSPEAIRRADSRFPKVSFLVGTAPEDLKAEARDADAFLLLDVLEHVADDLGLLSGLVEIARPGAHLVLTVPAGMEHWGPHDEAFGHLRRYTHDSLQELWAELPVECLLLSHYNSRLLLPARLVRRLGQIRGRASGRAGTDFTLPSAPVNRLLTEVFAGEVTTLVRRLRGEKGRGYVRGLSLVAVLRRTDAVREERGVPGGAE